jgi:hypothetical protein
MLRKTIIVYCALAVGATSITELLPLNYPQKLPGCYIWSQYCGIVALNYPPCCCKRIGWGEGKCMDTMYRYILKLIQLYQYNVSIQCIDKCIDKCIDTFGNTLYRYIVSIHCIAKMYCIDSMFIYFDTLYRYIVSIHCIDTLYRYIVSIHCIDTLYCPNVLYCRSVDTFYISRCRPLRI